MYNTFNIEKLSHKNPLDSLLDVCCLVRFINDSLGPNYDELELSELGKDGFRFILNLIETLLDRVRHLLSNEEIGEKFFK